MLQSTFQRKIIMQEEYKQYFQWKTQLKSYKLDPFCTLCDKLHDSNLPPKIYSNVAEWFHEDEFKGPFCKNGSERTYYKTMF